MCLAFVELFPPFGIAMVQLIDPAPCGKSIADKAFLQSLVAVGVLPPNTDSVRPEWISLGSTETEPKPPDGYVVSLARLHERGFGVPAAIMRWSCTTLPPMLSHRWRSSSPSARDTSGCWRIGTCGGTYSGESSTPSPSRRG